MNFNDKVVIITGSASGIGEETAVAFSKLKAKIILVDINKENLNKVSEKCKKAGASDVTQVSADLTKDGDVKRVVETTVKKYNKIDVLVNSAGILLNGDHILDENLLKVYDKVTAINLRAAVALTNLAAPALIKTKGSVVNISSVQAIIATASTIAYSISKAGLRHFTKCAALELASKGVRVNAVLPGPTRTNILQNVGLSEEEDRLLWADIKMNSPLNRVVNPDEIADMVVYLASDKARSITGAAYEVDAGWTLVGHATTSIDNVKEID